MYLPTWDAVVRGIGHEREAVRDAAARARVEWLDLSAGFMTVRNPEPMFGPGHYGSEGYAWLGRTMLAYLELFEMGRTTEAPSR